MTWHYDWGFGAIPGPSAKELRQKPRRNCRRKATVSVGRDCSNAAGFPGLTLMHPLPRNEPEVDPGANQGSPQEIKAVPILECREDVADHPGRQAIVSKINDPTQD